MLGLVCFFVLLGAFFQRVTGMGFALVSSPFLILLLGTSEGVVLVNLCLALSAASVMTRVWRLIDWRRLVRLLVPALIAVVPGTWLAVSVDKSVLELSIGLAMLLVLGLSLVLARLAVVATGGGGMGTTIAGSASGILTAAAGIGGPAVTAYAVVTKWDQQAFMATMQPFFAALGAFALVNRMLAEGSALPGLSLLEWLAIIPMLPLGVALGGTVARRIHDGVARSAVIAIAFLGAALAIVHGSLSLL